MLEYEKNVLKELIKPDLMGKFPPTLFYNEGWLLRIILEWFENNRDKTFEHNLCFYEESRWFSEGFLESPFKRINKEKLGLKDTIGEGYTRADGIIGDFKIGDKGKYDIRFSKDSKQFIVLESKMGSGISKDIKNANFYNQLVRTAACMINLTKNCEDLDMALYVIAPKMNAHKSDIETKMRTINESLEKRIKQYENRPDYLEKKQFAYIFKKKIQSVKIDFLSGKTL